MRVRFPNGVEVSAVPLCERRVDASDRNFGLYMDPAWAPTWAAERIEWEDLGLPKDSAKAVRATCGAYRRAAAGERVEIGCIGGLGRTGTVLACMAVLAGVPASEAVAWVHEHYDRDTITTAVRRVVDASSCPVLGFRDSNEGKRGKAWW